MAQIFPFTREAMIKALLLKLRRSFPNQIPAALRNGWFADWLGDLAPFTSKQIAEAFSDWERYPDVPWFPSPGMIIGRIRRSSDGADQ